jgi:hypothetical protein
MAASLHRLRTARDRLRAEDAERVRQMVLGLEHAPESAKSAIVAAVDRETAAREGWTFCMISPAQFEQVHEWLLNHSKRSRLAVRIWTHLFQHVRMDSNELVLTRQQLAERFTVPASHVSNVMAELEQVGAIERRHAAGRVTYLLNPRIGTHLAGEARDRAQREAPALRLVPSSATP